MRQRGQTRHRAAGLVLASLLHAVLFAGIFSRPPPAATDGLIDDGQRGMAVTLVRMPSSSSPPPAEPTEAQRLETLRVQLAGDLPVTPTDHKEAAQPDAQNILQTFDNNKSFEPPGAAQPAPVQTEARGVASVRDDPFMHASAPASRLGSRAPNLWPQLARCWTPAQTFPPVTLTVTLDDRGGLARQPEVLRDPARHPDKLLLDAEKEAKRAVIACAPYATQASDQRSFRLEFARSN